MFEGVKVKIRPFTSGICRTYYKWKRNHQPFYNKTRGYPKGSSSKDNSINSFIYIYGWQPISVPLSQDFLLKWQSLWLCSALQRSPLHWEGNSKILLSPLNWLHFHIPGKKKCGNRCIFKSFSNITTFNFKCYYNYYKWCKSYVWN